MFFYSTKGAVYTILFSEITLIAQLFSITLCDPMDRSLPGSFVHGVIPARILERVTISDPRRVIDQGTEPTSLAVAGRFFTTEAAGKSCHTYMAYNEYEIYFPSKKLIG